MSGTDLSYITSALQQSALFACLSPAELDVVARRVRPFVMGCGPVFLEGDRSSNAYLLVSGRVDISLLSSDGRELLLYRMGPGDFFGETAFLNDQPRTAAAIARMRCEVLSISRQALLDIISQNPHLALPMIVSLAQRLRTADETIRAIGFLDMTARLSRLLLLMEQEQGGEGMVHVTQTELATRVGGTRQSITRILATWRALGYVRSARSTIRLVNRRKLLAYTAGSRKSDTTLADRQPSRAT